MKLLLYTWLFGLLIFGCKSKIKSMQLSEKEATHPIANLSSTNKSEVKLVWDQLIIAKKKNDFDLFSSLSMDTIIACTKMIQLKKFFQNCSNDLLNDLFYNRIKDSSKIMEQDNELISKYYSPHFSFKLESLWRNLYDKACASRLKRH